MSIAADTRRIAYIDGLRAVAVLSVVACHAAQYSPAIDHNSALAFAFKQGCHGVDLFFVLSGFCLAYPALERLRRTGSSTFDVARYAARRIVRILPPYYAMIALLTIAGIAFAHARIALPPSMPPDGFTPIDVIKQMLFWDFKELPHLLNRGFWSLQVEFRWYFLFPVLLLIWTRSPRAFAIVALTTFVLAMTNAGSSDLNFLPAFMLGIVAAHIQTAKYRLAVLALPAFVALLPLGVLLTQPVPGTHMWHVISFFFVVAAGAITRLTRALSWKWLTFTGLASYSIYLMHEPTISFLEAHGTVALSAAVAGIAGGFLFWWIVERPFVDSRLRDRLLADFDAFLPRWFNRAGVSGTIALGRATAPAQPESEAASQRERELAVIDA